MTPVVKVLQHPKKQKGGGEGGVCAGRAGGEKCGRKETQPVFMGGVEEGGGDQGAVDSPW